LLLFLLLLGISKIFFKLGFYNRFQISVENIFIYFLFIFYLFFIMSLDFFNFFFLDVLGFLKIKYTYI
jgi:hypothetical protein